MFTILTLSNNQPSDLLLGDVGDKLGVRGDEIAEVEIKVDDADVTRLEISE